MKPRVVLFRNYNFNTSLCQFKNKIVSKALEDELFYFVYLNLHYFYLFQGERVFCVAINIFPPTHLSFINHVWLVVTMPMLSQDDWKFVSNLGVFLKKKFESHLLKKKQRNLEYDES